MDKQVQKHIFIKKSLFIICLIYLLLQSCSSDSSVSNNPTVENPKPGSPIIKTIPIVTTNTFSNITLTSASGGGNITSDGGDPVSSRGVVWNETVDPTIIYNLPKTTDGVGVGIFSSSLTKLKPSTKYYAKAYATNSVGTAYGNEISFTTTSYSYTQGPEVTDIDGNKYPTIITNCNGQIWMQKNLNVSRYKNGDIIPQVTDPTQWAKLTTGAWCYYENNNFNYYQNNIANSVVYGKLYNWYAVNDPRGLAPSGYHIPSASEWTIFTDCFGGINGVINNVGGAFMEKGNLRWPQVYYQSGLKKDPSNGSGFTALPGGQRSYDGKFDALKSAAWFWGLEPNSNLYASFSISNNHSANIWQSTAIPSTKAVGYSVRCVKN